MQKGSRDLLGPLDLFPECEGSLSSSLGEELGDGATAVVL